MSDDLRGTAHLFARLNNTIIDGGTGVGDTFVLMLSIYDTAVEDAVVDLQVWHADYGDADAIDAIKIEGEAAAALYIESVHNVQWFTFNAIELTGWPLSQVWQDTPNPLTAIQADWMSRP